ncbi:MAG: ComEC/Rec2 family competence protein, partial [Gemmataceae bacterium]
ARRRTVAIVVLAVLVAYLLLTGLRPSALRATVMVGVACGGIFLRRPLHRANTFLAAWLVVLCVDPVDLFRVGCQFSFLAVGLLIWFLGPWLTPDDQPPAPTEILIDEFRTPLERAVRQALAALRTLIIVTSVLSIATAPLVMFRQNLFPTVGILIGPLLVLLAAVALVIGFLGLVCCLLDPVFSTPFYAMLEPLLTLVRWSVTLADQLPGAWRHTPTPHLWVVLLFYGVLFGTVLLGPPFWRRGFLLLAMISIVGFARPGSGTNPPNTLRVTFLAVGHGNCTVIETPDGRVLLYDAGSMNGPEISRRVIAPFLWHRGHQRIDELFLSHADLDHYNAVRELLTRFRIGQVTMTPSFAEKQSPEVAELLAELARQGVPRRIVQAGQSLEAGPVQLQVLHPPGQGPSGSENERSLVLKVSHLGHTFLLTGDLEKAGAPMVLAKPLAAVDVVLAPHHGSRGAVTPEFLAWCRPGFVVTSRGPRRAETVPESLPHWDTPEQGAVEIRSDGTGLVAESFRTGERRVLQRGAAVNRP